jgi:hypothetical protein
MKKYEKKKKSIKYQDRRRKTEDRRPETEDRRPKTGDKALQHRKREKGKGKKE